MLKKSISSIVCLTLLWTSGNVAQAALLAPEVFALPSNFPQFKLQPPSELGRIVDYFNAASPPAPLPQGEGGPDAKRSGTGEAPLVILIQDLHAHYGVQKNIAGLLEFLAGKIPFSLAVEGASGPIDLSRLALFPDDKIKLATSDYLMREGELTGAEYFAIKRSQPHLLVGAENESYYLSHRNLFRQTLADRQELVKMLTSIRHDVDELPRYVFHKNKALRDFQQKIDTYDKGEMSTHEFIALLVSENRRIGKSDISHPFFDSPASIDIKRDFPALAAFSENSRFGTMDQIRAATEQFLTQAQGHLTGEEKSGMKVLAKNLGASTYYLYLREIVYKKQLFLAVPPELAQYMEYIHTAQTMGMDRVTHEAKELAFRIKLQLAASTPSAADLVQVQHDLDLLLRLADLQATEYEVRDFAPRLNQFVALTKALLAKSSSSFDENKIRQLISSSIDFYVMALVRNKPMIDHALALIGGTGHPATAVLVAGGFHTLQLTTMLRDKNVSYLVISPTVEKITDADRALYIKRLNGQLLTEDEIRAQAQQKDSTLRQVARAYKIEGSRADSLAIGEDVRTPAIEKTTEENLAGLEKGVTRSEFLRQAVIAIVSFLIGAIAMIKLGFWPKPTKIVLAPSPKVIALVLEELNDFAEKKISGNQITDPSAFFTFMKMLQRKKLSLGSNSFLAVEALRAAAPDPRRYLGSRDDAILIPLLQKLQSALETDQKLYANPDASIERAIVIGGLGPLIENSAVGAVAMMATILPFGLYITATQLILNRKEEETLLELRNKFQDEEILLLAYLLDLGKEELAEILVGSKRFIGREGPLSHILHELKISVLDLTKFREHLQAKRQDYFTPEMFRRIHAFAQAHHRNYDEDLDRLSGTLGWAWRAADGQHLETADVHILGAMHGAAHPAAPEDVDGLGLMKPATRPEAMRRAKAWVGDRFASRHPWLTEVVAAVRFAPTLEFDDTFNFKEFTADHLESGWRHRVIQGGTAFIWAAMALELFAIYWLVPHGPLQMLSYLLFFTALTSATARARALRVSQTIHYASRPLLLSSSGIGAFALALVDDAGYGSLLKTELAGVSVVAYLGMVAWLLAQLSAWLQSISWVERYGMRPLRWLMLGAPNLLAHGFLNLILSILSHLTGRRIPLLMKADGKQKPLDLDVGLFNTTAFMETIGQIIRSGKFKEHGTVSGIRILTYTPSALDEARAYGEIINGFSKIGTRVLIAKRPAVGGATSSSSRGPGAPLTRLGTYFWGYLYYFLHPSRWSEDRARLMKLNEIYSQAQPLTRLRAIELFYAPGAEKDSLLRKGFVDRHVNRTPAEREIRDKTVNAIIEAVDASAEEANRLLMKFVTDDLALSYEIATRAVEIAFGVRLNQVISHGLLNESMHFLHNLVHAHAVLTSGGIEKWTTSIVDSGLRSSDWADDLTVPLTDISTFHSVKWLVMRPLQIFGLGPRQEGPYDEDLKLYESEKKWIQHLAGRFWPTEVYHLHRHPEEWARRHPLPKVENPELTPERNSELAHELHLERIATAVLASFEGGERGRAGFKEGLVFGLFVLGVILFLYPIVLVSLFSIPFHSIYSQITPGQFLTMLAIVPGAGLAGWLLGIVSGQAEYHGPQNETLAPLTYSGSGVWLCFPEIRQWIVDLLAGKSTETLAISISPEIKPKARVQEMAPTRLDVSVPQKTLRVLAMVRKPYDGSMRYLINDKLKQRNLDLKIELVITETLEGTLEAEVAHPFDVVLGENDNRKNLLDLAAGIHVRHAAVPVFFLTTDPKKESLAQSHGFARAFHTDLILNQNTDQQNLFMELEKYIRSNEVSPPEESANLAKKRGDVSDVQVKESIRAIIPQAHFAWNGSGKSKHRGTDNDVDQTRIIVGDQNPVRKVWGRLSPDVQAWLETGDIVIIPGRFLKAVNPDNFQVARASLHRPVIYVSEDLWNKISQDASLDALAGLLEHEVSHKIGASEKEALEREHKETIDPTGRLDAAIDELRFEYMKERDWVMHVLSAVALLWHGLHMHERIAHFMRNFYETLMRPIHLHRDRMAGITRNGLSVPAVIAYLRHTPTTSSSENLNDPALVPGSNDENVRTIQEELIGRSA